MLQTTTKGTARRINPRPYLTDLVNHTFFPKRLPDSETIQLPVIELVLLNRLARVAANVLQPLSLTKACGVLSSWEKVQFRTLPLSKALELLQDNDSVGVYVRKQNCTVLFTQLTPEYIRVITIQPSVPNEYITKTSGPLLVTYPQTVDIVPKSELLLSECFSKQVIYLTLNRCEMAMHKSAKAGTLHVETNEPPDSGIVSEFLVTMLSPVPSASFGAIADISKLRVGKKLRDQVNWTSRSLPFRRSGLWTSAKVVMTLILNEEFTNIQDAKLAYKIFMLETLVDIGRAYSRVPGSTWDIVAQVMVKLARRAKKLTLLPATSSGPLDAQRTKTLQKTFETIEAVTMKFSHEWRKTAIGTAHGHRIREISRSQEDWEEDSIHVMDKLAAYLTMDRIQTKPKQKLDPLQMITSVVVTNEDNIDDLIRSSNQSPYRPHQSMFAVSGDTSVRSKALDLSPNEDPHLNGINLWIYQVERFVRQQLAESIPCEKIYRLLQEYLGKALPLYGNDYRDPIGYSRMIVTVLKIVSVLDKIAVRKFRLLSAYKRGIQSSMFESLLIPDNGDMKLLEEILAYFDKCNAAASSPDWLDCAELTGTTFGCVFAEKSPEMQSLKKEILDEMEEKIAAKHCEVDAARKRCEELQKQISKSNHVKKWNEGRRIWQHIDNQCDLCNFKKWLESARKSVSLYQRPLPPGAHSRNIVVFELLIPTELAVLRQSVLLLLEDTLGKKKLERGGDQVRKYWANFSGLRKYQRGKSSTNLYCLGSTTDDTLNSHYGRTRPDVFSDYSSFVLENGLTCVYYRNKDSPPADVTLKSFTMTISSTAEPDRGLYESLQFALEVKPPTENEVIAKQYMCHPKLSLREFKAFGALRSANLVQLRNLYAEVASRVLSLDKEPVLQLILQTLWETGHGKKYNHTDFVGEANEQFAEAFLEILGATCEENATNWSNPNVFLSLIMITTRILVLTTSHNIKEKSAKLLRRYRAVLEEWAATLDSLVSRTVVNSEVQGLMEAQLKCALSMTFTYNVETNEDLNWVLQTTSDVKHYLCGLFQLHQLINRENLLHRKPPSTFMANLLRRARVTIPLNLQKFLHSRLTDLAFQQGLHDFVRGNWFGAQNVVKVPAYERSSVASKRHAYQAAYYCNGALHSVFVDIIRGTFFVDGFPPSVLPEDITRAPLFKSFFLSSKFRVQRDCQGFKTVDKYRGHDFQFIDPSTSGSELVIRQLYPDGSYYELLPKNLFHGKVAEDLIEPYTHWYCSKTKAIHFRYLSTSKTDGSLEEDTRYLMCQAHPRNQTEWQIINYEGPHVPPKFNLLSIESQGFREITRNLVRLDSPMYVHVQLGKTDKSITGKLWRLDLSFKCKNGLLYCNNYPQFYISTTRSRGQNLGTLVGLTMGVTLEMKSSAEISGKKKMFLVPHSRVIIKQGDRHQIVNLSPTRRRNPVYFLYEVDQVLKRLKPGSSKSAWLYLALLHGSTSSPFPDPFTQLKGTEMAMWILQSGFSWSCSPYDKDCTRILEQIADLSPKYKYYPEHLNNSQITEWPVGLEKNSYAAYDGYVLLVRKLLNDSTRLEGLFREKSKEKKQVALTLSLKSYERHINMYNKAAHLTGLFMPPGDFKSEAVSLPISIMTDKTSKLLTLAKCRYQKIPVQTSETIRSLIMSTKALPEGLSDNLTKDSVIHWLRKGSFPFRSIWMSLYALAHGQTTSDPKGSLTHELTMIYGAFLYSGNASLEQLLNLHNIEVSSNFPSPLKSLTGSPYTPLAKEYQASIVKEILKTGATPYPTSLSMDFHAKMHHEKKVDLQIESCERSLRQFWPTEQINTSDLTSAIATQPLLNHSTKLESCMNMVLKEWYNNRNLELFIYQVEKRMGEAIRGCPYQLSNVNQTAHLEFVGRPFEIDAWLLTENLFRILPSDGNSFQSEYQEINLAKDITGQREKWMEISTKISDTVNHIVRGDKGINTAMHTAGIRQIVAPIVLLRDYLMSTPCLQINALAVAWANIKRLNRIMTFNEDPVKYAIELQTEFKSVECEAWSATDNPEWLLLELELDITIRSVQVEVARQMMEMPGEKNGVMQLNMGEGKTSVIIPMIVSTLSRKKDVLCRVTVLNSIFAMNFNLLGVTIGGLLNKRLYTVPCNRNMNIGDYAKKITDTYKECMGLGGTVITVPEHRLSFRLQIYDNILQGKYEVGREIHKTETWLRHNARDLVDESDEVFSVKYQLIYTTGKQEKIDGGNLRWMVCQKLLELVPKVAAELLEKYGEKVVEFQAQEAEINPDQFKNLRILSDRCKETFLELMVEGVLEGKVNLIHILLQDHDRKLLKDFLLDESITEQRHKEFLTFLSTSGLSSDEKETLFLLSGYLRRGIMFAALKKRWRVEYGVKRDGDGPSVKLTAVPFRAKDVAAERSEFGHPDMAIVLTQLSYFYSGLSDEDLQTCFSILENSVTAPEVVYNSWIKKIPMENIKSDTVKTYHGINLHDYQQRRDFLFPILRYNTAVINFWLEKVVFPKECRQFPGKLVTNAFDLCYEGNSHATTGFSGTNDTSLLHPVQITQQDLQTLSETNVQMEETLRRPENMVKRSLKMGEGCTALIQYMIEDGLQVLIDSGALMLELGNEEIANLWLELDKRLEAVAYFNEKSQLVVKVRNNDGERKQNIDTLLALSPYKDRLEKCAVYLDDQHTRGTDIKLPTTFKACVTIGSGMRRDKLIQACMRMRKLGKGQSVHFYLSHEVLNKITKEIVLPIEGISTLDIIDWTKFNSAQFEMDGLVYWATNAIKYSKNLAADDLFEVSGKTVKCWKQLAVRCQDPDAQSLELMYGTYHQRIMFTKLISHLVSGVVQKLTSKESLPKFLEERFSRMEKLLIKKCEKHIPEKVYFQSVLDEEQEKELEPEQEQEENIQRLSQETPCEPFLNPNVEYTIRASQDLRPSDGISQLFSNFNRTTMKRILQVNGSGDRCFVTEDFNRTVEEYWTVDKSDKFLKSIRFVVSFGVQKPGFMLVLSQYEVNKLVQLIRSGRCAPGTKLHLFSGRWMEGQSIFINDPRLQLPFSGNRVQEVGEDLVAPLLVAAGNLYFNRKSQEEKAFAKFLGLALKPWTDEEKNAFEEGIINSKGFVLPTYPGLRQGCSFQTDPNEMVLAILKLRNDALRDCDHVIHVLNTCTSVWQNTDDVSLCISNYEFRDQVVEPANSAKDNSWK